MQHFDHLKLICGDLVELARFRRWLIVQDGAIAIEHEDDGRCCRREAWNATSIRIHHAVRPPRPVVVVNLPFGV